MEGKTGNKKRMLSLTQEEQKWVKYFIAFVILGGGSAAGFYFLYRWLKNQQADREASMGFDTGNPASYAKRIRQSLDFFWGTDEESLRRTLREIPSYSFWEDTVKSYRRQYERNLINDLESDLSNTEFVEMMQIVNSKRQPGEGITQAKLQAWADRLKAAFDYKAANLFDSVDRDAIKAVLNEVPSKVDWESLKTAYQNRYVDDLWEVMKDELWWWELDDLEAIINKKP